MSSSNTGNALIKSAQQSGNLSPETVQAVNIPDLGTKVSDGLGVTTDDVCASQAMLVNMLIDDSQSIQHAGNADAVRTGYNYVVEALQGSKQRDSVFALTRYINGTLLYPYTPIDQVPRMDAGNYNPAGQTPLFDESVVTLGTIAAKAEDFAASGVPVRSVTLIVTDGDDLHSRQTAADVKRWVSDLLAQETHIVAGMGIDDGYTDFAQVFREMGIPDEWILTPGDTPSEIRTAFGIFSQSAVQVSQGATSADLGGFGT